MIEYILTFGGLVVGFHILELFFYLGKWYGNRTKQAVNQSIEERACRFAPELKKHTWIDTDGSTRFYAEEPTLNTRELVGGAVKATELAGGWDKIEYRVIQKEKPIEGEEIPFEIV